MSGPAVLPVVAALLLAAALLALTPPRSHPPRTRPSPADAPRPRPALLVALVAVAGVPVLGALGLPLVRGLLLALGGAVLLRGVLAILQRRALSREILRGRAWVQEACESLAADLASGRPTPLALAAAATRHPALGTVTAASDLGADVPAAWRQLAAAPGCDGLRAVAAAWEVSWRTGAGLAPALDAVAARLRADAATALVVSGELASARATARLVALLPLAAWGIGASSGGRPLAFLLGSTGGVVCLLAGLGLAVLGLRWIETIALDVDGQVRA